MINFWKLYKKAAPFFQISSEIRKGAAQSLTAYDWHSSKNASQHVCIYGTIKNRVHILPLIFKLISVYFSWICHKKHFRCNLFQVASKVLNKHGGTAQIWTGEWRFCRPLPYHLATVPFFDYERRNAIRRSYLLCWSGWRGSNSLPPPWQGGALPDELHPHLWCLRSESNQRHGDFQSPALPTELQRQTPKALG